MRPDIIEAVREAGIAHWRVASARLGASGIYRRGRSGSPREGRPYYVDLWCWQNQRLVQLAHNISPHRAEVIEWAWRGGTIGDYSPEVISNYASGGYSTRIGLDRAQSRYNRDPKYRERLMRIARSHADYLGHESGNSSLDHMRRVDMRRMASA